MKGSYLITYSFGSGMQVDTVERIKKEKKKPQTFKKDFTWDKIN